MVELMEPLRVVAFQRRPHFDDVSRITQRLAEDLRSCDQQRAHLALFPECYLQGYATDKAAIARRALALNGTEFGVVLAKLAPFRTTIVLGIIEQRGNACYSSAAVIKDGVLMGAYAKSHPNESCFAAGAEFPVFDTAGWKFGINICNDANFPDAALRVSSQGARLLCLPLNNMLPAGTAEKWRSRSIQNLQQRAIETGCWVVSSDVVGEQGEFISLGCTCIVSPEGRVVSQATERSEGSIMFDLN